MKKEITFFELLQMMKEGTAPKSVEYGAAKWIRSDDDYCCGDRIFLSDEIGKKYMREILNKKCVSYDEAVLTGKEREYLSAVLKPFKNRVEFVRKCCAFDENCYYLRIEMDNEAFSLPEFGKYIDMYSGMKVNQAYTPSELGLWEEE